MQAGVDLFNMDVMPIFMIIAVDIVITLRFSINCSTVICSPTVLFAFKREASQWYAWVLYKWFLTPFRDDIWNHRQVSVGVGGVLPTRPKNHRGYALLAHTFGKMRSCATGKRANTVIHTVVLKNTIIQEKSLPVVSKSHTVSPC